MGAALVKGLGLTALCSDHGLARAVGTETPCELQLPSWPVSCGPRIVIRHGAVGTETLCEQQLPSWPVSCPCVVAPYVHLLLGFRSLEPPGPEEHSSETAGQETFPGEVPVPVVDLACVGA